MSGSGWQLPLTRLRDDAATNQVVRNAIQKTLADAWHRMVPLEYRHLALGWISLGSDSLLTIQENDEEIPTHLTFWFYESVDWGRHLAEHWLHHAVAQRRRDFETVLERLGFAIPSASWPTLLDVLAEEPHYFVHGHSIGQLEGQEVHWVYDGNDDVTPSSTPLSELPEDVGKRIATLDHCACPLCATDDATERISLVANKSHRVEPVWASASIGAVLSRRDGTLLVDNNAVEFHAWTVCRTSRGWTTIPTLTDAKRRVDAFIDTGDALVAIMGYSARKPPRVASTSRDGGATWTPLAPTLLPEMPSPVFVPQPHRPRVVYALANKTLFRSGDGGMTFGARIAPTVGDAPREIRHVVEFESRTIVAARRSSRSPCFIAVAEANAKTEFTPLDLGGFAAKTLACSAQGVVAAFGSRDNHPIAMRSHDEGRTWTESPAPPAIHSAVLGPRWFAVEYGVGLHASDDEGATWTRIVDGACSIFPDAVDPRSVYVTTNMARVLAHVRPA